MANDEWGPWKLFDAPLTGSYIQLKCVFRGSGFAEYFEGRVLKVYGAQIILENSLMKPGYAAIAWRHRRNDQFKQLERIAQEARL